MGDSFLLDAARGAHFIGLAIGFGLAICADIMAARSVIAPIREREAVLMRLMHRTIMTGLVMLWASGLYLVHIRTGWEASAFTPKLIVKLGVVILLSVNALLIGAYALPRYGANIGRRFGQIDLHVRVRLAAIAGVSLSCWTSALALGVFSLLKPMSFEALQAVFAPVFLAGLVGAVALAVVSGLVVRLSGAMTQAEEKWPVDTSLNRVTTRALHS